MDENAISHEVIAAAIEVHKHLGGPGLLESVYEEALVWELRNRGLLVDRQVPCPIMYKGVELGTSLRLDLVVEKLVIVECKATQDDHPIFETQVLTYLRIKALKLGLLINFGKPVLREGISRVVNGL